MDRNGDKDQALFSIVGECVLATLDSVMFTVP